MDFRLNDDEILAFIARGYHIFHPAIDAEIHRTVCAQTRAAFVQGKNPGNAIYEQVPALSRCCRIRRWWERSRASWARIITCSATAMPT